LPSGPAGEHRDATGPPEDVLAVENRRIGAYKLLRVLGEGGMGIVYEALQEEPVRRTVAVKLIKRGMDSKAVIARFESERQALALMNHPNIARVLDAGESGDGRPFFVMDLVRGLPVTDYCDLHRLPTHERLGLLLQVCDAIQHAHQKGIIHRDIKPTNVLVSVETGGPAVKVIDFGVAKAIVQPLTEKTLFTAAGQFVGTPAYMSPEQAELSGLDVDTRTDLYSLGVLAYELLTGTLPFEPAALRGAAFSEMLRIIREEEPVRPSVRLGTQGEALRTTAHRRRSGSRSLPSQLRGDLDWIVMKALEKDRTRRYSTVSEFAADIRRHLANEPVLAGPPSAAYRLRKFVRRHRVGVAAVAAVAAALLLGIAGTTLAMVRAVRAEGSAKAEARAARQTSEFLVDLFTVPSPKSGRGKTVTARELIEKGSAGIRQDRFLDARVRARLLQTIGLVYRNLGLYGEARPLLDEALSTRTALLGERHPETAESLNTVGSVLYLTGQPEVARPYFERALAIQSQTLDSSDPEQARTLNNLANVHLDAQDLDGARALYERALAIREKALGPEHPDVAKMLNNLGVVLRRQGQFTDSRKVLERALTIREHVLAPSHRDIAISLDNLALVLLELHDDARARELLERADRICVETLGPDHPNRIEILRALAVARGRTGDAEGSRAAEDQIRASEQRTAAPDAPVAPPVAP
jgi:serine/threonine protein kinase/tetratricopeptide (TPR) repeat protein